MEEIWKDIKGYEGLYQVSNLGNVKSLKCNKEKLLNLNYKHNRYGRVYLYKDNKKEEKNIHRLVAETFIPNIENKPQVNHIDNNSQNNRVDNLEWVTIQENVLHAYKIGVSKPPMINRKHNEETKEKISNKLKGKTAWNASFNEKEAKDIIRRKLNKEKRKEVFKHYKHKISKLGFENIWYRKSYKNIWEEMI